jgi:hypothetical protein
MKAVSPERSRDRHRRCDGSFKVETREGDLTAFCNCVCHRKEEAVMV